MQSRSALPLARGLPCERFTAALASRTSCITRGRGGWLDLPRGGLSPPILCQLPGALRVGPSTDSRDATKFIQPGPNTLFGTHGREVRGFAAQYKSTEADVCRHFANTLPSLIEQA